LSYQVSAVDIHENESVLSVSSDILLQVIGDVNFDGLLNVTDVIVMVQFVLGNQGFDDQQLMIGDCNGDGAIDISDIVTIIYQIVGIEVVSRDNFESSNYAITTGNGEFRISNFDKVVGIQVIINGDMEIIETYLSDTWELYYNDNIVLLFSDEGVPLDDQLIFEYSGDFEVLNSIIVDYDINASHADIYYIPRNFSLHPAYPNPFNPITKVDFEIPFNDNIKLSIYDIRGREIDILYDGNINAGYHQMLWNAAQFSSGVYFVALVSSSYRSTHKIILLK